MHRHFFLWSYCWCLPQPLTGKSAAVTINYTIYLKDRSRGMCLLQQPSPMAKHTVKSCLITNEKINWKYCEICTVPQFFLKRWEIFLSSTSQELSKNSIHPNSNYMGFSPQVLRHRDLFSFISILPITSFLLTQLWVSLSHPLCRTKIGKLFFFNLTFFPPQFF